MRAARPITTTRRTALAALAAAGTTAGLAGPASARPQEQERGAAVIGPARGRRLHLMSFNIRMHDEDADPGDPDYWPRRRPALTRLLRREQPGLLGVQEAEFDQIPAIEAALPEHRMVGYGRQGGSRDEYSAIFYDAGRFTVRAWDQVWLSDTPTVIGSTSWGNEVTRIVTWARLADRRTGGELVHVNTHFDHKSEPARVRSAAAVVELTEEFAGLPVLVTGDFNSPAGDSGAYRRLVTDGPFTDSWRSARRRLTPEWGTFPNYEAPVVGEDRIDWVLTRGDVQVAAAGINAHPQQGVWPSDHAPVQALLEVG